MLQLFPCHFHQLQSTRKSYTSCSQTTTTATTLSPRRVGWGWGNILDAANLHAGASKSTESRLGTWARGLGAVTTGSPDLDVEGSDAQLLAADGDVLSSQHGGVWGGLVTVGLDLHATGDTADGFAAREIGNVDEGVVKRGEDAGDAENELAFANIGAEGDVLRNGTLDLLGSHCC